MNRRIPKGALLLVAGVVALALYWLLKRNDEDDFDDMMEEMEEVDLSSELPGDSTLEPPWGDEEYAVRSQLPGDNTLDPPWGDEGENTNTQGN